MTRRSRRLEEQRRALVELVRWAQAGGNGPDEHPAGPTTDAATVATRIFETGRVKVRRS